MRSVHPISIVMVALPVVAAFFPEVSARIVASRFGTGALVLSLAAIATLLALFAGGVIGKQALLLGLVPSWQVALIFFSHRLFWAHLQRFPANVWLKFGPGLLWDRTLCSIVLVFGILVPTLVIGPIFAR